MPINLPTKEEARARYWEVDAQIEAIMAKSMPLREARDLEYNAARAALTAVDEKHMPAILEIEKDLYDLAVEKAQMAALAGGNVGEKPGRVTAEG